MSYNPKYGSYITVTIFKAQSLELLKRNHIHLRWLMQIIESLPIVNFSTDKLKKKATIYAKESLSHVRVCEDDEDEDDD